jgi:hypothetical protein
MEIKGSKTENKLAKTKLSFGYQMVNTRTRTILFLLVCILLAFSFFAGALTYHLGFAKMAYGTVKSYFIDTGDGSNYFLNYIRGKFARPERVYIDIKHEDYQTLLYWRGLAIKNKTLHGVDHDYVNARIRHKDDTIPVKIRLKGGVSEQHMVGRKWSMRVKVRGDKTFFGMKKFVLMEPKRQCRLLAWVLYQVMKEEGLISKRYKFVEVIINGENKGIYAMEEHFGKIMIEANQRREGPIIRLSEDPLWLEGAAFKSDPWLDGYYLSVDIDAIGLGKNEVLSRQFEKARNLFDAFRHGDLPTKEVFDIDKLAKWMAVSNVMGAWHGVEVLTMKFYYNPITSKLEPIPHDHYNEVYAYIEERLFSLHHMSRYKFFAQIFSDLVFMEKYLQSLERVSRKSYFDDILNTLSEEMEENLHILYKDDFNYKSPKYQLYKSQEYIRGILNPYKGIVVYYKEIRAKSLILCIANVKEIPMEILNVTYEKGTVLEPVQERTILRGKERLKPLSYNEIEFRFPSGFDRNILLSKLKVNYRILGNSGLRNESVFPWPSYDLSFLDDDFIRLQPNFQDFHFIRVDLSKKEMLVQQGHWILNKSLVVPEGYTFIISAGTNLDLTNGAKILSYAPIRFIGSDNDPIIIESSDSTGQGIAILNAGKESFLENVVFENLSVPFQSDWELTGAITFYESPVSFFKCKFLGARSEDALNIIRSRFIIDNSLFKNSASDALDVDFGKGSILNTSFIDSGNDAIDLSGSVTDISKSYINNAGDKGISVGEKSEVTADGIEIKTSKVGIASKDSSKISIKDVQLYNSKIGFAAYQKKPEFGHGIISAKGVMSMDVSTMYQIEQGSILVLNGNKIEGTQRDVAKEIYKE